MKSKISSPDLLKELKSSSYKSLLEKDLENLKKEKELQNFFIITEHKFACGSLEPLLVVGLTPEWKSFLKEQISTSNKNFGTGECKIKPDGKAISLGLDRGKAKPSEIEKSFKKNPVLKNIKPEFSILDATMDDALSAAEEDNITNAIFTTIKKQLEEYKSAKPNDKLNKLKILKRSIDEWQTNFDSQKNQSDEEYKIAGSLAKLEAQLDAEVAILNKVDAPQNANPKNGNAALFDEIRQEFAEVKNLNIKSELHTKADLEKILKEIDDVITLVLMWETNNPFNPNEDASVIAQRKQIDVLHNNMRQYVAFVNQRIQDNDYVDDYFSHTPTSDSSRALAGFKPGEDTKDKAFDELLDACDKIKVFLSTSSKNFEQLISTDNKDNIALEKDRQEAEVNFFTRVKKIQEQAQTWLKNSKKGTYLLPASKKAAQQKELAVMDIIQMLSERLKEIWDKIHGSPNPDIAVEIAENLETLRHNAKSDEKTKDYFFAKSFSSYYNSIFNKKNQALQDLFRQFLKTEHNEEPLDFLLETQDNDVYKNTANAQSLYETYIVTNAPKEVNLPADFTKPLFEIFDIIKKDIQHLHENSIESKDISDEILKATKDEDIWIRLIKLPEWQNGVKKIINTVRNELFLDSFSRFMKDKYSKEAILKIDKIYL